jgi:hypothetical protein
VDQTNYVIVYCQLVLILQRHLISQFTVVTNVAGLSQQTYASARLLESELDKTFASSALH